MSGKPSGGPGTNQYQTKPGGTTATKTRTESSAVASAVHPDPPSAKEASSVRLDEWFDSDAPAPPEEDADQWEFTLNSGESFTVVSGAFDAAADNVFRRGQCHAFAIAAYATTDWPLRAIRDAETGVIRHVGVLTSDGWFYDIQGEHDISALEVDGEIVSEVTADEAQQMAQGQGAWDPPELSMGFAFSYDRLLMDGRDDDIIL